MALYNSNIDCRQRQVQNPWNWNNRLQLFCDESFIMPCFMGHIGYLIPFSTDREDRLGSSPGQYLMLPELSFHFHVLIPVFGLSLLSPNLLYLSERRELSFYCPFTISFSLPLPFSTVAYHTLFPWQCGPQAILIADTCWRVHESAD